MIRSILTISIFFCYNAMFSQEYNSKKNSKYYSENTQQKKYEFQDYKAFEDYYNLQESQQQSLQRVDEYLNEQALFKEQQKKKQNEAEEAFQRDIVNYYSKSNIRAMPVNEYKAIAQQHLKNKALPVSEQSIYPNSELRVKKNISIFEAFFQGLGSTILGILFITLIIGVLRILFSRKTSTNQIENKEKMILPEDLENELTINIRSTEKKDKINYNEIIKNKLADLRQVFNNRITRISKKIKTLNPNEMIILSVAIGAFSFIILGYGFAEKERFVYYKGGKYYISRDEEYSDLETTTKLNYGLAFPGFIITAGISYLFLNSKKKVQKNNNDNYEI